LVILSNKVKHMDVQVEMNGAPSFAARRSQIGQVLANLIGNACDASQQQLGDDNGGANSGLPILRIEAQEKLRNEVNCLWVEIHESGPGIPEELREKILEPFFTTKEVGMGTGLGMPIVQRILESHGGGLQIGDSALLGGACMAFWIPREQVQETDETV
jgi:signal transduction histidine kinase